MGAQMGRLTLGGFVTPTVAHFGMTAKVAHNDFVRPPPVSACDHPARRLALCEISRSAIATSKIWLAERGLDVSYETVRRWVLKFGPLFARALRHRRPRPTTQWHLDEMAVMIVGRRFWLWRAVDDEGEVLDLLVQRRRDEAAAVKLMGRLIKKQGFARRCW